MPRKGYKQTPEHRAKIAAALRGREMTPEALENLRNSRQSPEYRAKLSAAMRGRTASPEARAKQAAAQRGRKQSPETIARRAAKNRGQKRTPEQRARISAALRKTEVGYVRAHERLYADRGQARDHQCTACNKQAADWALRRGAGTKRDAQGRIYSLTPDDYLPLCVPCHRRYDNGTITRAA